MYGVSHLFVNNYNFSLQTKGYIVNECTVKLPVKISFSISMNSSINSTEYGNNAHKFPGMLFMWLSFIECYLFY